MWNRRRYLQAVPALFAARYATPVSAQFRVEISGIGATQVPMALVPFRDEGTAPQAVSAIVRADLERSGVFRFVDAPGALDETSAPVFADWRARAADALVAGSVTRLVDGRYDIRYKLWDVLKGQDQGGLSLAVQAADLRLAAHRIADAIYEKLTGDKGVFATRIAYVTKAGERYTLRVTDADGEGGQVALSSPAPIISPAWSPDGKELAYVSFETRKAVVWTQNVSTGARRAVANFRGSNSAPAFSPDGRDLAVTLSRDGGSQIFLIGRDGSNPRRITQSHSIDTESVFAPDGQSLYFVSDRGGGPQVYRQAISGGNAERITFSGAYNISPHLSPDGRLLTYVMRQNGNFKVVTMDLSSGTLQQLSDTNEDERPSFAPNGRLIIYATHVQGRDVLMTTTLDGKIKTRLMASGLDVREPIWGPYGR
jgi:TolB protein